MRTKLMLDEQLSPWAAVQLQRLGWDVIHVRDRGMTGASDDDVFRCAFGEDRALVTINVRDFVKLAQRVELHPGLVLISEGQYTRSEQLQLLASAISAIEAFEKEGQDLVNRALHVDGAGSIRIKELPLP